MNIKYREEQYKVVDVWSDEENKVTTIRCYKIFVWGFSVLEITHVNNRIDYDLNTIIDSDIKAYIKETSEKNG